MKIESVSLTGITKEELAELWDIYVKLGLRRTRTSKKSFIETYFKYNKSKHEWCLVLYKGLIQIGKDDDENVLTFLDFKEKYGTDKPLEKSINKEIHKEKSTDMEIYKEKTIEINGKLRQVIVSVSIMNQKVYAGYSITHIDDKFDTNIGKKIAKGRALNDRTNAVDMVIGKGMDKKFILYAIADHVFRNLENGVIQIRGVK